MCNSYFKSLSVRLIPGMGIDLNAQILYDTCMAKISIGTNPRLEAIREGDAPRLAVITHPHPLYGGNMHNNVVATARDAALAHGFSALRFNFRGVGSSDGLHDGGPGEIEDLATVLDFSGERPIILGYSFGAWIAAGLLKRRELPCILIAPPSAMFAFPPLKGLPVWAVVGAQDQFYDTATFETVLDAGRLTIIDGVDHFWFGRESALRAYLDQMLPML